MRLTALISCCLMGWAIAESASACPNFDLVAQPASTQGYSPNDHAPLSLQIELYLVDGPAEASCTAHVIELSSQTSRSVRSLSNGRSTIQAVTPPGQSAFASVNSSTLRLPQAAVDQLVSTGRLLFEYAWIEPGEFYPAGRYFNILDVELNGLDVATLETEVTVTPAMRLLGDVASGYGHIDFGTLESYEEASTNFMYQTNSKLTVTASSLNNGYLVHENGANLYSVPYSTWVNDAPIQMNGTQSMRLDGNLGARNLGSVRLRLGEIGHPVAGAYGDILTLSFTAE